MGHSLSFKRIIRQIPFCLVCTLVVALCMVIPYLDSKHDQANAQSRSDAKAVEADPGCPVYDDQMLFPQVPSGKGSGFPTDDKAQLSYNSIQYDMTVLPNGDVQVREHLDVRLRKQVIDGNVVPFDSLSANFGLSDDSSFSDRPQGQIGGISGVTIKDAVSGQVYRHVSGNDFPVDVNGSSQGQQQAGVWKADVLDLYGPGPHGRVDYAPAEVPADAALTKSDMELAVHRSDVSLQWTIPETVSAKSLRFDISMTLKNALTRCGNRTYFLYDTRSNVNGPVEHVAVRLKLPPHVTGEPEGFINYSGNQRVRRKGLREIDMDTYNVRMISGPVFAFMFDASGMGAIKHDIAWNSQKCEFFDKGSAETDERTAGCSKDSAASGSSARCGCSDMASNGGDSDNEADDESTSSSDWLSNVSQFVPVLVLVLILGVVIIIITNRQTSWKGDIPYNEDIPKISPASAAMFIDVVEPKTANASTLSRRNTREMLSTLLSLAQKKAIALYPGAASWYLGLDLANAGEDEIRACAEAGRAERNASTADSEEDTGLNHDFAGNAGNTGNLRNADNPGTRQACRRHTVRAENSGRAQSLLSRALWRTRLGWIIRQYPRLARFFGDIPKPADGRTVTVRLLPALDGKKPAASVSRLTPSELALLEYLQDFAQWQGSQVFDLNQLRNSTQSWDENSYARHAAKLGKSGELAHRPADPQRVWTEGVKARQSFFHSADEEYKALKLVRLSELSALSLLIIGPLADLGYHILLDIWNEGHQEVALALGLPAVFLVAMVLTLMQYKTLTGDGRHAEGQLLGLKKYMKDFSDFSRRDVESLPIWGQYLIYAVALGMDTEVMRQLAFRLPSNLYKDD